MQDGARVGDAAVPAEEAGWIEDLRRGDEAAFVRLLKQEGGRLLAVARRLMGEEDEARDVVQDVLLSVVRKLPEFRGDARLSTWLYRLAVRAGGMRLRKRATRAEEAIGTLLPEYLSDGHRVLSEDGNPVLQLEERELRSRVRASIDSLPEPHRGVLVLRDIEGIDTEETAELLGLAPGAVRTRLHRARQALRELLVKEGIRP